MKQLCILPVHSGHRHTSSVKGEAVIHAVLSTCFLKVDCFSYPLRRGIWKSCRRTSALSQDSACFSAAFRELTLGKGMVLHSCLKLLLAVRSHNQPGQAGDLIHEDLADFVRNSSDHGELVQRKHMYSPTDSLLCTLRQMETGGG